MTLSQTSGEAGDRQSRLDYVPGACNIGPAEIARRRRIGHTGLATTLGLLAVLVLLDAPRSARLSIVLPATAAATGYLQARVGFCVAFGFKGVFNFGQLGEEQPVADTARVATDRRRALRLMAVATGIGMVAAIGAALFPGTVARQSMQSRRPSTALR